MAKETLLLIQADHALAEVVRSYFGARGYTMWVATTGAKGIQLAQSEHPALIILDDALTDLPVDEVLEALRTNPITAQIPLILLKQNTGRADQIAGLMSDGDEVIAKPFDVQEVHQRVQSALARPNRGGEAPQMEEAVNEPEAAAPADEPEPLDDWLREKDDTKKSDDFFEDTLIPSAPIAPPAPAAQPAPVPPPAPRPITPPVPPQASGGIPLTEVDRTPVPKPAPGGAPSAQSIQFGAYHAREIVPNEWKPLIAYVYYDSAEADVQADAGKQLGPLLSGFRKLTQAAKGLINEGANITATPYLPGFQFNPPSVAVAFYENWHRFDFKLRAKEAPLHHAVNGTITFTVEGVIVGDVPLSVYVTEKEQNAPTQQASSKIYDTVFCSYSRKDLHIIERVERAYKALGLEYLRDMTTLRSGEEWSDELKELITRADIFQLFWSPASSVSDHVRMEWEYALTMEGARPGFIRPVYWTQPIPNVPPTLSHLHFAYEPDLVD